MRYKEANETKFEDSLAGLIQQQVRLEKGILLLGKGLTPESVAMTLELTKQLLKVVEKISALETKAQAGEPIRIM